MSYSLVDCYFDLSSCRKSSCFLFFFFNDTATTEIYTLSLHDALPISPPPGLPVPDRARHGPAPASHRDRKSTRLNSSHSQISYAVFCLKKKKRNPKKTLIPGDTPAIIKEPSGATVMTQVTTDRTECLS